MISDISEKQLEANRANAQKSTGPRTTAGKQRSRLNALRHGCTAQVDIMTEEEREASNKFINEIVESLHPEDANQRQLARLYADLHCRINRAGAVENTMFTLGLIEENAENLNIEHAEAHVAASHAKTFRSQAREFEKISLYSQRMINQAEKVLKQLKQLQAEIREKFLRQISQASRMYRFHEMQEAAFDPKANGFDLTIEQIKASLDRSSLETQSWKAEKLRFNRQEYFKKYGQAA